MESFSKIFILGSRSIKLLCISPSFPVAHSHEGVYKEQKAQRPSDKERKAHTIHQLRKSSFNNPKLWAFDSRVKYNMSDVKEDKYI